MRRYLVALALSACTTPGVASDEPSNLKRELARETVGDTIRIETRAGAFLVREGCAQELRQVLAGEMTEHPIWAGK